MTDEYGNELLHRVLLSAMKDVDGICRENGLRYYLHAGTLLGAMNFRGFIPWDDDVDITMMRADYDVFCAEVTKRFPDRYFMQTYKTDPALGHNRGVLRILGTAVDFIHTPGGKGRREIGLDIVPLYGVPDSAAARKIQSGRIRLYDTAVQIKLGEIVPQKPWTKCLKLLAARDRTELGEKLDRIMRAGSRDDSRDVGVLCYTGRNPYTGASGYENDIMPRAWYREPIYVSFEDTEFMTVSEPKEYLDRRYGPRWAEPYPEEKRVTKHDVKEYAVEPRVRERVGL